MVLGAGVVTVIYGSGSGLTASGEQVWSQATTGIQGQPEFDDEFGWALAAGDFDGDGFTDLGIGVDEEDVSGHVEAGAVSVIYGSGSGLTATGDDVWTQDGLEGQPETGDLFGWALAAGDFDGDGYSDLGIGAIQESVVGHTNVGSVNVIYGSGSGLTANGDDLWSQDSDGLQGQPEVHDFFGWALTAGDFDGDGYADLGVGAPFEDVAGTIDVGVVNVIYGSGRGLTIIGDDVWSQETLGILGQLELGDDFGSALGVGDFDGDGYSDLVVGTPNEDVVGHTDAGSVNVIYGSGSGLTINGDDLWSQHSDGIQSQPESDDRFGDAVRSG